MVVQARENPQGSQENRSPNTEQTRRPDAAAGTEIADSSLTPSNRMDSQKAILAERGARGSVVEQLQRDLNATGFRTGVDRSFGPETERNLSKFEVKSGLEKDGKLDTDSQRILQAEAGRLRAQDLSEKPIVSLGDKGLLVECLQRELVRNGYSVGRRGADGDFGGRTESALAAFRKSCGLSPEGGATPTVIKLLGIEDKLAQIAASHLKLLGERADLSNSENLETALKRFQGIAGLPQTGKPDIQTVQNLTSRTEKLIAQIEKTPIALEWGMRGEVVDQLQKQLSDLGYLKSDKKLSGRVDAQTIAALNDWRADNGLTENGRITLGVLSRLDIKLRTFSQDLVDKVKYFEGFYPKAKLCPGGELTIGHGHTGDVRWGQTITREAADSTLRLDLAQSAIAIQNRFGSSLSQSTFDALVSFHFNLGGEWMKDSNLAKALDQDNLKSAAERIKRYVNADGRELPGLVKRRSVEASMLTKEDRTQLWVSNE